MSFKSWIKVRLSHLWLYHLRRDKKGEQEEKYLFAPGDWFHTGVRRPDCHRGLAWSPGRRQRAHVQSCPPCSAIHHLVTDFLSSPSYSATLGCVPVFPSSPPTLQNWGCHSFFFSVVGSPPASLNHPPHHHYHSIPLSVHLKHSGGLKLLSASSGCGSHCLVKFSLTVQRWWWVGRSMRPCSAQVR